jgi:hypothetical protein
MVCDQMILGQDTNEILYGYIEIQGLVTTIPIGVFDWILFDACPMASVEVLYEL